MIKTLRGFRDIYGEEWDKFWYIVETFRGILGRYNVRWIDTPIVEQAELFIRSVGEFTDIVQKQMFIFKDRGGRNVALRPEGTAGIVRAYIENGFVPPVKLAYFGPMFRAERPQKGRYRQFYQIGVEFIGYDGSHADAECILSAYECVRGLDVKAKVYINTLGGDDAKRRFSSFLKDYLKEMDFLCEDCKVRREKNPLRVLDCKICSPKLEVPDIMEFVDEEEKRDFTKTLELLQKFEVPIERDPKLVRGLDYYTGMVFEIKSEELESAQNTILSGGRYDDLVSELGGKDTPACGWAAGIDRISLILRKESKKDELYFIVRTSDEYMDIAFDILHKLRKCGKTADMIFDRGKSLRSQMKKANKLGAKWVVFVGEEEVKSGRYKIRDMDTGEESIFTI